MYYYGTLHMCNVLEGRAPLGNQELKAESESPNLGRQFRTRLVVFQALSLIWQIAIIHRPQPGQLPRQHKCEDTLRLLVLPLLQINLLLRKDREACSFHQWSFIPFTFLLSPPRPRASSHCCQGPLPVADLYCVRQPLSDFTSPWPFCNSLFLVVCSQGSVTRERKKGTLSIPAGRDQLMFLFVPS